MTPEELAEGRRGLAEQPAAGISLLREAPAAQVRALARFSAGRLPTVWRRKDDATAAVRS